MPTCPKGHTSQATDYCDECGTPIGAAPTPAPAASPPASSPGAAPASTPPSPDAGQPCPDCATPRSDRFCEVCGHDFLAEPASSPAPASPTPSPLPAGTVPPAAVSTPDSAAAWRITVTADRVFYQRMQASADPDATPVPFPTYCPERRFSLTGTEVLIGRSSRSRGIEPQVDLTGPPEDAAVSHMHALLVATPDGGWTVVDLDSANGTYLNDATEQLPPHQPVALADGDRIHVGTWTTLTVRSG